MTKVIPTDGQCFNEAIVTILGYMPPWESKDGLWHMKYLKRLNDEESVYSVSSEDGIYWTKRQGFQRDL